MGKVTEYHAYNETQEMSALNNTNTWDTTVLPLTISVILSRL